MRLSADTNDVGYDPVESPMAEVYLDGVLMKYCITADEERGQVKVYVLDAAGEMVINPVTNDIRTEWRTGQVKIVLKEHQA